jgi:L-alanine-DL-glutamate epimerase-like enolase superfamily enzyme
MKISCKQFELELKHPFSISKFTRTSTPILLLKLDYEGFTGYGEASMVPYMGESQETAAAFLAKVEWQKFKHPFNFSEIHVYLDEIESGNPAIKAAIDIALNDINGKILNQTCALIYGADPAKMPITSYTIG